MASTKTDIAVREIKKRILTGVYQSGMRLRQNELVEDLGLGVTPVREAFMQLISEGLLVRKPYAGVIVASVNTDSVTEVYAIRKVLEKYAIEMACLSITEKELAELSIQLDIMRQAHQANEQKLYQTANESFHRLIYSASRNNRLVELIELQWQSFPKGVFGFSDERRAQSLDEHEQIFRSLSNKDPLTAGANIVSHIANSERIIKDLIHQQRKTTT